MLADRVPRLDGARPRRPHHRSREHPHRTAARRPRRARRACRTSATNPGSSWRSASTPAAACPSRDLLAEYRDVTAERLARLATARGFAARRDGARTSSVSPRCVRCSPSACSISGPTSRTSAARSREPGGLDGVAAAHSRERMLMGAGNELQERLGPPAGTAIVFDVTGPGGALRVDHVRRRARAVRQRRSRESPASTLRLDLPTLTVLACGRSDDPGARSRVVVEGDQNLATARARGPGGHAVNVRMLATGVRVAR